VYEYVCRFWQDLTEAHLFYGCNLLQHSSDAELAGVTTSSPAALEVMGGMACTVTLQQCDFQVVSSLVPTIHKKQLQMVRACSSLSPFSTTTIHMSRCTLGSERFLPCVGKLVFTGNPVVGSSIKCVMDDACSMFKTCEMVLSDNTKFVAKGGCVFHDGAHIFAYPSCHMYMEQCVVYVNKYLSSQGSGKVDSRQALVTTRNHNTTLGESKCMNMFHLHFHDLTLFFPVICDNLLKETDRILWSHEDYVIKTGEKSWNGMVDVNRNAQVVWHMSGKLCIKFFGDGDAFCDPTKIHKQRLESLMSSNLCLAHSVGLSEASVVGFGESKTRLFMYFGADLSLTLSDSMWDKSGTSCHSHEESMQLYRTFRSAWLCGLSLEVDGFHDHAGMKSIYEKVKQRLLIPTWNVNLENFMVLRDLKVYESVVAGMLLSERIRVSSCSSPCLSLLKNVDVCYNEEILLLSSIPTQGTFTLQHLGETAASVCVCLFAAGRKEKDLYLFDASGKYRNMINEGDMCITMKNIHFDFFTPSEACSKHSKYFFMAPNVSLLSQHVSKMDSAVNHLCMRMCTAVTKFGLVGRSVHVPLQSQAVSKTPVPPSVGGLRISVYMSMCAVNYGSTEGWNGSGNSSVLYGVYGSVQTHLFNTTFGRRMPMNKALHPDGLCEKHSSFRAFVSGSHVSIAPLSKDRKSQLAATLCTVDSSSWESAGQHTSIYLVSV
jgi:hypothetical protein